MGNIGSAGAACFMACMVTDKFAGTVIYLYRGGVIMKNKQLTDDKADANELACLIKNENSEIKPVKARGAVSMLKYK